MSYNALNEELCDCTANCGDDSRVWKDRSVRPCAGYVNLDHAMAIEIERDRRMEALRRLVGGADELGVLRAALLAISTMRAASAAATTSAASGRPDQGHQQGSASSAASPAPP